MTHLLYEKIFMPNKKSLQNFSFVLLLSQGYNEDGDVCVSEGVIVIGGGPTVERLFKCIVSVIASENQNM